METVGLYEIGVYIACQQNMVKQYIVTCPIMCLCLVEERSPGMKLLWRWWEQTNLDILGINQSGALNLRYVLAQVREEAAEVHCCGYRETDEEVILDVRDANDDSNLIHVLGTHSVVHQLLLSISGAESPLGAGKIKKNGKYLGERRNG